MLRKSKFVNHIEEIPCTTNIPLIIVEIKTMINSKKIR